MNELVSREREMIDGLIAGQETLQKVIADKNNQIENLEHKIGKQNQIKEIYLQRMVKAALLHCIAVDSDLVYDYEDWDEYLMETLGTNQSDVEKFVGIKLPDITEYKSRPQSRKNAYCRRV